MEVYLSWTSPEYSSVEHCHVRMSASGAEIASTIDGSYEGKHFRVDYRLLTNERWETRQLEINCLYEQLQQVYLLENSGAGIWMVNGIEAAQLRHCIDVDIPLTPLTNTLPIRRLAWMQGKSYEIGVIYCDLLAQQIRPVRQRYTCLSDAAYHYENIPNDFEATIEVDVAGFVMHYPSLFERAAGSITL